MVVQRGRGSQPVYTADESTLTLSGTKVFSEKTGGTGATQVASGVARIQRGTYTGDGAGNQAIAVGFRPQFVFIARAGGTITGTGLLIDGVDNNEAGFLASGPTAEGSAAVDFTATGFTVIAAGAPYNVNAVVYYWLALGNAA